MVEATATKRGTGDLPITEMAVGATPPSAADPVEQSSRCVNPPCVSAQARSLARRRKPKMEPVLGGVFPAD